MGRAGKYAGNCRRKGAVGRGRQKQEEALPEEGEKLEEEVLQEDEEEKTEECAAAESVPGVEEQKEETLEMEVPVENEKITVVRGESSNWKTGEFF